VTESPTAIEEWAGSTVEIDNGGDFVVNTSDALGGDVYIRLSGGRAFNIEVDGTTVFEVASDGSSVRIDLGGGSSERLVLGDKLKTVLNDFFQTKFDLHTHPTTAPGAPTLAPLPLFIGTQITDDVLSDVTRTKKQ